MCVSAELTRNTFRRGYDWHCKVWMSGFYGMHVVILIFQGIAWKALIWLEWLWTCVIRFQPTERRSQSFYSFRLNGVTRGRRQQQHQCSIANKRILFSEFWMAIDQSKYSCQSIYWNLSLGTILCATQCKRHTYTIHYTCIPFQYPRCQSMCERT